MFLGNALRHAVSFGEGIARLKRKLNGTGQPALPTAQAVGGGAGAGAAAGRVQPMAARLLLPFFFKEIPKA